MRKSILIIFPFCGDYIHEKTEKGEHLARHASSSKRSELHAKACVAGDMHLMVRDILLRNAIYGYAVRYAAIPPKVHSTFRGPQRGTICPWGYPLFRIPH